MCAVAAVALVGGVLASRLGREGYAFALVAASIVTATGALFSALFPAVLRSSTSSLFTLTVANAVVAGEDTGPDDRDRVRVPALRPALPGLDLLGVPETDHRPRQHAG